MVLVSAEMARRHFSGEDPIGRQITLGWSRDSIVDGEVVGEKWVAGEVVGIVGDVREFGMGRDAPATLYFPYEQVPERPPWTSCCALPFRPCRWLPP